MAKHQIGDITASIAGDYRYTTRITVEYDPDTHDVVIKRMENGAVGGMDGPGGSHGFGVTGEKHLDATRQSAQQIVNEIKNMFDNTVTRYGKPTKNFFWQYTNEFGLSKQKLANAIAMQRKLCCIIPALVPSSKK